MVQRVSEASVTVDGDIVGSIGNGLVVLLGVAVDDEESDAVFLAEKVVHLRIFEDEAGKMNRSLLDTRGSLLVVSQFTLLGDCRKGRRPSFVRAAPPEKAEVLYGAFSRMVAEKGVRVATGRFRTFMDVRLVNNGPVTLVIDSR
ncbi:MAG: D-aminoacyl-tRNA deacylase [Desulfobacterales bacterium]